MTIQQLEYILEVNRAGSMSKAAKKLFVSHSTVSNAVAALEEELGYPVFIRNSRGVAATERGRDVLEHAAQVCEHLRWMQEGKAPVSRHIRIETTASYCCYNTTLRLLEEYRGREDLRFCQETFQSIKSSFDKLSTLDLDLVVHDCMSAFLHEFEKEVTLRGLEARRLGVIPAVIKIGPEHPLYHKKNLLPKDFKDDVFIDSPKAKKSNSSVLKTLIGFDPERTLLLPSWKFRYEAVSKGFGFSVGRRSPEYIDQTYGFRNIPLPEIQYYVFCIFHPSRPLGPELERYVELLEEELEPLCID